MTNLRENDGASTLIAPSRNRCRTEWSAIVPESEWVVYAKALDAILPLRCPFMIGGAFGLACYTGRWRNTKDLDFFVLPEHHEAFVDALLKAGFVDYHETLAYDRGWIFRAVADGVIVDVIWDTPNRRARVEPVWFERAPQVSLRGETMLAIPAEELLFIKTFVLQKDRCDWSDLMNLLCFQAGHLDWEYVLARYGEEVPLLRALLNVFAWLCPIEASQIPEPIRARIGLEVTVPENAAEVTKRRVALLDSRPWFSAFQPMDVPMLL